jgi:uncharacterized ferritin-like protein (DUF455 family)
MAETIEDWAERFIGTTDLTAKLAPPPRPAAFRADREAVAPLRIDRPGRPPELRLVARAEKMPRRGALAHARKRAELFHTFAHHELQAAELMAWALLAFPETPRAFRLGLLGILDDELRHLASYLDAEVMRSTGVVFGDHPVRDWFWERVPRAQTAAHFVAVMGIGFEGGNLDHTARFTTLFREHGDEDGARRLGAVGEEEVPHVRFALHWFERWTGARDFAAWCAHLPPPLSPVTMRGPALDDEARARAGFPADFVERLRGWTLATTAPAATPA